MKTWRANQSGTFSNRVNVGDRDDEVIFVIEHSHNIPTEERLRHTKLITNAPDLLQALQEITEHFKTVEPLYSRDKYIIEKCEQVIKALNI